MTCVVIFFWSTQIIDCLLFTFENRVLLMRYWASVVWCLSIPWMNSFNKTEAATFPCKQHVCFLMISPFLSLIYIRRQCIYFKGKLPDPTSFLLVSQIARTTHPLNWSINVDFWRDPILSGIFSNGPRLRPTIDTALAIESAE